MEPEGGRFPGPDASARAAAPFVLALAAALAALPAGACSVLVVGTDSQCSGGNGSRITDAAVHLASRGYAVTALSSYPASLGPYDVVWDPRCGTPLSASEMTQLAAFVAGGKGVFLQSEYPGPDGGRNATINNLLNNYVCAGSAAIHPSNTVSGGGSPTQLINPAAPGGLPTNPWNLVGSPITPAGAAVFSSYGTGLWLLDLDSAGVWPCGSLCGGTGKIVIMLDSNWLDLGGGYDTPANLNFAHNIAEYLCSPCVVGSPTITYTISQTPTITRTATVSGTPTVSATASATRTATATETPLLSFGLTLGTFTSTPTAVPTGSSTSTWTSSLPASATPTVPPAGTATGSATVAASTTAPSSATASASPTASDSATAPPTPTQSATRTPGALGSPTATAGPPYFLLDRNILRDGLEANFRFRLAGSGRVRIRVLNSAGELVRNVFDELVEAGEARAVPWDGRNESGKPVSANVYVARASHPDASRPVYLPIAVVP